MLANTNWATRATRKDKWLPADGLVGWRSPCLEHLIRRCKRCARACDAHDVYEFGVYTGRSMRGISQKLFDNNITFGRMWGFDSFEGLPPDESTAKSNRWRKGDFNAADALRTHTPTELFNRLERYIGDSRIGWVPGFYNESLTARLAEDRRMQPALFVDVDCDLYSSAERALDWMFENRLIVPGSVVGYDDWFAGGERGEQVAHREVAVRYNASFRRVRHSVAAQPCWELVSLGESGAGGLFSNC